MTVKWSGAVAVLCVCLLSCAPSGPRPTVERAATAITTGPAGEDQAILAASRAIRSNHLTEVADECLAYDATDSKENYLVDVRENHRKAQCGGDPNVSPRLFSIKVSKANGSMETDQGSDSGAFRAISK